jgi:hypothetical protein
MSTNSHTTFGYVNVWAKGAFADDVSEYGMHEGLLLSGNVSIKKEQADALIAYLQDDSNYNEYGAKLDIAVFYDEEKKVAFSGSIKTPYVKGNNAGDSQRREPASARAKRQL